MISEAARSGAATDPGPRRMNGQPRKGTTMPTDDSARLRAALDQIANALQPAVVIAGQLHRVSAATVQDIAKLDSALARAVTILKTLQLERPE